MTDTMDAARYQNQSQQHQNCADVKYRSTLTPHETVSFLITSTLTELARVTQFLSVWYRLVTRHTWVHPTYCLCVRVCFMFEWHICFSYQLNTLYLPPQDQTYIILFTQRTWLKIVATPYAGFRVLINLPWPLVTGNLNGPLIVVVTIIKRSLAFAFCFQVISDWRRSQEIRLFKIAGQRSI